MKAELSTSYSAIANRKYRSQIKERMLLDVEANGRITDPYLLDRISKRREADRNKRGRSNELRRTKRDGKPRTEIVRFRLTLSDEERKELDDERRREWFRANNKRIYEKIKNNPTRLLAARYRIRLNKMIKRAGAVRDETSKELLGCTFDFFLEHLSKQFSDGMSWENYGAWHIDHKKPCASFDFNNASERRECFHYTNLQPLWAEDNRRKSNKL